MPKTRSFETDYKTFIKFWSVPVLIYLVYIFLDKAAVGLVMVGASIFLALALKPLVRRVNSFFTKHLGKDKHRQFLPI